jgi:hypothetical protein
VLKIRLYAEVRDADTDIPVSFLYSFQVAAPAGALATIYPNDGRRASLKVTVLQKLPTRY